MFETILVIIDESARPILMIPEELPKGKTFLNIVKDGIDIGVDGKIYGAIREMDETALILLGLQDEVGMATFKGEEGEKMPETIEYMAEVRETRYG